MDRVGYEAKMACTLFSNGPPTPWATTGIKPWSEALRTAQAKVEAATSPGVFGHDAPDMHNLTTSDILFMFGVAAVGSILAYGMNGHWMHCMERTKSGQQITNATSTS